jgi:hypothetical protein
MRDVEMSTYATVANLRACGATHDGHFIGHSHRPR